MKRQSGVLLHISSLPSEYSIGDLGDGAYTFVNKLKDSGFSMWQILPLNPAGWGGTPYMSTSAMGIDINLLSPDKLAQDGFIEDSDKYITHIKNENIIDYAKAREVKIAVIKEAYEKFKISKNKDISKNFKSFKTKYKHFSTIAIFEAIAKFNGYEWLKWPTKLKNNNQTEIKKFEKENKDLIEEILFGQFLVFSQWIDLRTFANSKGVSIIGDIPIYVSFNSSDVWSNTNIFDLNKKTLVQKTSAGVPPDYFSEDGQLWGNPLYKWFTSDGKLSKDITKWWKNRFAFMFDLFDIVRIDHFRAFESYWAVKFGEKTAKLGKWEDGPGVKFFKSIFKKIKIDPSRIIAEDLGIITDEVEQLRDELNFPGMKVLQFAFDNSKNKYLPGNYDTTNCVVYTGTHDNNTTKGWFNEDANDNDKHFIWQYTKREYNEGTITDLFIDEALGSVANFAIIPMQDLLNLGSDARMNTPSKPNDNWRWKLSFTQLNNFDVNKYKETNTIYNRILED